MVTIGYQLDNLQASLYQLYLLYQKGNLVTWMVPIGLDDDSDDGTVMDLPNDPSDTGVNASGVRKPRVRPTKPTTGKESDQAG